MHTTKNIHSSVLDLVAASVGGKEGATQGQEGTGHGSSIFDIGATTDESKGAGGAGAAAPSFLPSPSEEPWGEEQYSAFAVNSFLTNVLGISSGTSNNAAAVTSTTTVGGSGLNDERGKR